MTSGNKRAVIYLRVSSPGQVNTDYNPEGISLPAQREAAQRKELELGADNVGEYVEPGRSAIVRHQTSSAEVTDAETLRTQSSLANMLGRIERSAQAHCAEGVRVEPSQTELECPPLFCGLGRAGAFDETRNHRSAART